MNLLQAYLQGQAFLGTDEVYFEEALSPAPSPIVTLDSRQNLKQSSPQNFTQTATQSAQKVKDTQVSTTAQNQKSKDAEIESRFVSAERNSTTENTKGLLSETLDRLLNQRGGKGIQKTAIEAVRVRNEIPEFSSADQLHEHMQQAGLLGKSPSEWLAAEGKGPIALISFAPELGEGSDLHRYSPEEETLLDKMLLAIQLSRNDLYQSCLCKNPRLESPLSRRSAYKLSAYLQRELQMAGVKLVLVLGERTLQALIKSGKKLEEFRGEAIKLEGFEVIATYSLRDLLTNQELKRDAWKDLQFFKSKTLEWIEN